MAEIENKYGSIVTDVGIQLVTEAVMEGQKVNITTLAVGDGGGSYYKPNSTMTALKGEKWRGKVNRVEVNEKSPNMIDVVAVVPSDVGGWTIREMGVFDDAEEPNMIAVCNTPDTEKVIITSGAAGEIELTMHIEISNTGAISFVIDPNVVTATKKDLADHNTSQTAHAAEFEKKADVTALNDHANNSDIHVNPTTMGNYDTAIAGLIDHTEDTEVHVQPGERAAWDAGAEAAEQAEADAAEALSAIAGLESRVSRVEDGLFNNITGNPFLVQFDSLDGVVMVRRFIRDPDVLWLVDMIIDSTDDPGIPIGNQTSQWFAVMYLSGLDHFIKEKLGIRYYGRYMDDFYLIHEDKAYLQCCRREIEKYVAGLGLCFTVTLQRAFSCP